MAKVKAKPIIIGGVKHYPRKDTSPAKAIRLFCFECCGMWRTQKNPEKPFEDVKNCPDILCPLWEFRFGKSPYYKNKGKGNPHLLKNSKVAR